MTKSARKIVGRSGVLLTSQEYQFVQEYLAMPMPDAYAALRAIGIVGANRSRASQWLERKHIETELNYVVKERAQKAQISQERVLLELARVGFADLRQVAEWDKNGLTLKPSSEISSDAAASIAEIEQTEFKGKKTVKVKLIDKNKALEMIAKHLSMFVNRIQIDSNSNSSVEVKVVEIDPAERNAQIMTILEQAVVSGYLHGKHDRVVLDDGDVIDVSARQITSGDRLP